MSVRHSLVSMKNLKNSFIFKNLIEIKIENTNKGEK